MYGFINRFLKKKRRGFSLIEVMAVVVIMGIVAAGAVNIVGNNAEKARYTQAEKDLDSILAAIGAAYTEKGSFCGAVTTGKLHLAFTNDFKLALEKQLSHELADITDPWGNAYGIVSTTYADATKTGKITLVCTNNATGTYDVGTNCRTNPNNNNKKLYRVVYSQ